MRDDLNPLVQTSPLAGSLVEETVSGTTTGRLGPENGVDVVESVDRSMLVYVPRSGCPHAKQTQVLMVLRDDAGPESAQRLLGTLGLAKLAEERHFIVVFPDPLEGGWHYAPGRDRENDTAFLVRCFAALPSSSVHVAGFNGMIFHLATSPASSALVMSLAVTSPLDAAAVMVGALPQDFDIPEGYGAGQVAWLYEHDERVREYLAETNGCGVADEPVSGVIRHASLGTPCLCHFVSGRGLSRTEVADAWEFMFSETRRWRNDIYGTYQPRIPFRDRGFVAHVSDASLPLPDGLPRTWYEFVPEDLAPEPAPLVIYLHGINCVGLYGAEQSGWSDIAAREGMMCVFPDATIENRWNVWDDPRLPLDMDYVLALIDHMDAVHPVDRSRVYLSGFSMGSMFSNALAASHPDVFAGVVAMNGPHLGYLETLDQSAPSMLAIGQKKAISSIEHSDAPLSPTHVEADAAREAHDVRMPFVQFVGNLDGVGMGSGHAWPLTGVDDGMWPDTIAYWLCFDNVSDALRRDASTASGLAADECEYIPDRFSHQSWRSSDAGCPEYYHLFVVERMPHAVDLREVELGWEIVRHWARNADGTLRRID